jgi:hypothetical protein
MFEGTIFFVLLLIGFSSAQLCTPLSCDSLIGEAQQWSVVIFHGVSSCKERMGQHVDHNWKSISS